MTVASQSIIQAFEKLPETDKREVSLEIIRRSLAIDFPPLTDEQLVFRAEELFLELDRLEDENGQT